MLVKFISIERHFSGKYALSEIMLNPKHIVMIAEAPSWKTRLQEGQLPDGLHEATTFSRVVLTESSPHQSEMVLVGTPSEIQSKILKNQKRLLRG